MDTSRYREILTRIRDYLLIYADQKWSGRVDEWIHELNESSSPKSLRLHIERSQKATSGMGSLGDLTICPQNGHRIQNDRQLISEASNGLWALTSELYQESKALLTQLLDH